MEKPDFSQIKESLQPSVGINDMKEFLREYEVDRVGIEFKNRVITLVIASLGLITALAWDETLRAFFKNFFGDTTSLGEHAFYAVFITSVAVIVSYILSKIVHKEKPGRKK